MSKTLISVGPIYGKLDSVKIITNKFKGGLASLTAKKLAKKRPEDEITIVKCKETEFYKKDEPKLNNIKIVDVSDFYEYEYYVLNNEFDAYILAAAVANLIPEKPYDGKFPSHNYKEGEIINIPFVISRRVIDHVKEKFPKSTLIGYKLFDGTDDELIKAGWKTLVESKANAVFCNRPNTAKERKIVLLPDGSKITLTFEEHIDFINRLLNLKWYNTEILANNKPDLIDSNKLIDILKKTTELIYPYFFGCVAYKLGTGFYTTLRGKKETTPDFAYVYAVDHDKQIVSANKKASLNAPLLDLVFKTTNAKVVLHAHKVLNTLTVAYTFPGTTEEDALIEIIEKCKQNGINSFNIEHHGYIAWFDNLNDAQRFINDLK